MLGRVLEQIDDRLGGIMKIADEFRLSVNFCPDFHALQFRRDKQHFRVNRKRQTAL